MRILFDNDIPKPIARALLGHQVTFARQISWYKMPNGELIRQAEDAGYDLLLSTDKNIKYQQNLAERKIALVVLGSSQWPTVQLHLDRIVAAIEISKSGGYTEVEIPLTR